MWITGKQIMRNKIIVLRFIVTLHKWITQTVSKWNTHIITSYLHNSFSNGSRLPGPHPLILQQLSKTIIIFRIGIQIIRRSWFLSYIENHDNFWITYWKFDHSDLPVKVDVQHTPTPLHRIPEDQTRKIKFSWTIIFIIFMNSIWSTCERGRSA